MLKKGKFLAFGVFSLLAGASLAGEIKLENLTYRGPIDLTSPWIMNPVDVNNKPFNQDSWLDSHINQKILPESRGDSMMVFNNSESQLHFLSFPLVNKHFAQVDLKVSGAKAYKIYLDNKETSGNFKIKPGVHEVTIKFLSKGGESDTIKISALSPQSQFISNYKEGNKRDYTLEDVLYVDHISDVKVSPSGKYAIINETLTTPDNKTVSEHNIIDLKNGKKILSLSTDGQWMENQDLIWYGRDESNGEKSIVTISPFDMEESIFASNVPDGDFIISPTNDFLVYFTSSEGPREDPDIYRVINPEDRQPGYRNRSSLAHYDLNSGVYRPLIFGNKNVSLQDISPDGKKLLLMSQRNRFEKRPTSVFSIFELDLNNMKVDTLVFEDGFINGAQYSPNGNFIAITGSPESLNSIGKNVPEGRIPSMIDGQVYIMDLLTKEINPITKNFNPSVTQIYWHPFSGNIYMLAEDKDKISLFEYNPSKEIFTKVKQPEDIVKNFSFARNASNGALIGESATNPENLLTLDFVKGKYIPKILKSTGEDVMKEVRLAEVVDWDFVNSVGDTINGRYYLPPNFDSTKKYPLIVNYYGGCSPTSRNFASRYPHHVYANQGYVVYVLNPSGATGFGQEFSSRHVNTAGEGVARDIIEGTKKFTEEHPYIDEEKIGCIGASYGGFMTQYLQTVSDIFAAAISHAGISDHTSYWGNGYWGYSYSEVSMAESYPWKDKDLFVNQSPLYNADKINTPLLFLHGDGDTNVPPMESVQLFTALKLLGKDTALVEVTDQNHHILEPEKRKKWQDTIFAWFAKYLQDDPTWWEDLYPSTPL